MIESEVSSVCQGLARHEQVKKVAVLEEEFSIERGEITPTLKVKRREVEKRYSDRIKEIYS
jgi:long-chain acyl-CoA synthetase